MGQYDPNQLSRALVALKGLADNQDQRIMELACHGEYVGPVN